MPTAKSDSDIVLSKTDGSSSVVGIKLHKSSNNLPGGYRIEHVSPAPPRQVSDSANYQQQSPDIGLVLDQQTWHRGFGASFIEQFGTASEANAAKAVYGYTEDALAMFKGEITTGYLIDESDTMLRNGRFESVVDDAFTTDPWTKSASGMTLEADTSSTYVRNGKAGAKVITTGTSQYIEQTLNVPTAYRSRKIFLHGYIKRVSGSGSATVSIREDGSATGSSQAISDTDFTNIRLSSSATTDLNVTIGGSTSAIVIRVTFSASGDTFALDDFSIIPDGGVVATEPQEFGGNIYVGCGRQILQWDDSLNYWKPVYWDSQYAITSLASYHSQTTGNSVLYAARGEYKADTSIEGSMIIETEQTYLISSNGTTWTDPSGSGDNVNSKASYFTVARNASGDLALVKSRANQINLSTDGSNVSNFGTEIPAGNPDRSIVNLFSSNDLLYVGREDGLLQYDRATNKFLDLQPEANFFPDHHNFRVAQGRSGAIFASGGDQSFFKITQGSFAGSYVFEDQSFLFKAPTFRGFGGRISGLAQDKNNLFVALADDLGSEGGFPYTFPFSLAGQGISKSVKLLSVRTQRDNASSAPVEVAHTLTSFTVTQVYQMGKFQGSERNSLFVFGSNIDDNANDSNNQKEPRFFRVRMPVRNENPSLNAITEQQFTGNFYSPFINFNFPDVNKTGVKLTLTGLNLDANKFVTVFYKTDDATDDDSAGWNTWGSDGKFTSSGQTVTSVLSTLTNFDRIRFKLQFTSNVTSSAPRVTSLVFHAAWNPIDYRKWTAVAKLTDKRSLQLRRTVKSGLSSADITNLETLRKEPFVLFTDIDGSSHHVNLRYTDDLIATRVYANRNTAPEQTRVFTLEMTEVKTT